MSPKKWTISNTVRRKNRFSEKSLFFLKISNKPSTIGQNIEKNQMLAKVCRTDNDRQVRTSEQASKVAFDTQ
jgi:hypothetical protein